MNDPAELEPPARVIAKAEWTKGEVNPRFVITSLRRDECKAKYLYEKVYCVRGDMENRIKECQLDLYADRTSTATMRANQLRLSSTTLAKSAASEAPYYRSLTLCSCSAHEYGGRAR